MSGVLNALAGIATSVLNGIAGGAAQIVRYSPRDWFMRVVALSALELLKRDTEGSQSTAGEGNADLDEASWCQISIKDAREDLYQEYDNPTLDNIRQCLQKALGSMEWRVCPEMKDVPHGRAFASVGGIIHQVDRDLQRGGLHLVVNGQIFKSCQEVKEYIQGFLTSQSFIPISLSNLFTGDKAIPMLCYCNQAIFVEVTDFVLKVFNRDDFVMALQRNPQKATREDPNSKIVLELTKDKQALSAEQKFEVVTIDNERRVLAEVTGLIDFDLKSNNCKIGYRVDKVY